MPGHNSRPLTAVWELVTLQLSSYWSKGSSATLWLSHPSEDRPVHLELVLSLDGSAGEHPSQGEVSYRSCEKRHIGIGAHDMGMLVQPIIDVISCPPGNPHIAAASQLLQWASRRAHHWNPKSDARRGRAPWRGSG